MKHVGDARRSLVRASHSSRAEIRTTWSATPKSAHPCILRTSERRAEGDAVVRARARDGNRRLGIVGDGGPARVESARDEEHVVDAEGEDEEGRDLVEAGVEAGVGAEWGIDGHGWLAPAGGHQVEGAPPRLRTSVTIIVMCRPQKDAMPIADATDAETMQMPVRGWRRGVGRRTARVERRMPTA